MTDTIDYSEFTERFEQSIESMCNVEESIKECGHEWEFHEASCECCMIEYLESINQYDRAFDPMDLLQSYFQYKYKSFDWNELVSVAMHPDRMEKHLSYYDTVDEALKHF